MKIGLVSEEFPPYMFGGIASFCRDLAFNLARRGVQTTVLCGSSRPSSIETPIENLRIVRLPLFQFPPRFLWFQIQNYSHVFGLLKDVDVFHAVNPLSAAIPMYFGSKLGTPCVVSIHGNYRGNLTTVSASLRYCSPGDIATHLLEYPLKEFLSKLFRKASDHFIVCSFSTLREFRACYSEVPLDRFTVIYNGIDLKILEDQNSKDEGSANHSLIYFGRLFFQKGVTYLIKSFDLLRRTVPDAVLDIYGKGPMESRLRRLISRLGLQGAVRLKGMMPRPDLMARMKNYDVVVLPSLYEAQPVAALEAMAMRKPLVMFDGTFSRELIENMSNGVLARAVDIRDLARKIEMILTDRNLAQRLGETARKYVEKNHNWDSLIKKYIDVYEKLRDVKQIERKRA